MRGGTNSLKEKAYGATSIDPKSNLRNLISCFQDCHKFKFWYANLWRKVINSLSLIMNVLSRMNALGRRREEAVDCSPSFFFFFLEHEKHRPAESAYCLLTSLINTDMNKFWYL